MENFINILILKERIWNPLWGRRVNSARGHAPIMPLFHDLKFPENLDNLVGYIQSLGD